MKKHLEYIAQEIKKLQEFAHELQKQEWWEEYYYQVNKKAQEIVRYAEEHNVPIKIDVEAIAESEYEGAYSEETSSSYYDEDESSYF